MILKCGITWTLWVLNMKKVLYAVCMLFRATYAGSISNYFIPTRNRLSILEIRDKETRQENKVVVVFSTEQLQQLDEPLDKCSFTFVVLKSLPMPATRNMSKAQRAGVTTSEHRCIACKSILRPTFHSGNNFLRCRRLVFDYFFYFIFVFQHSTGYIV